MKNKLINPRYIIPILILVISYLLIIYLFIAKERLLENQIGRITALIDIGGIAGISYVKKLAKKYWLATLWILAFVIGAATIFQTLAVSELHSVLARIEISGEPSAVANCELDVYFLDSVRNSSRP